MIVDVAIVGAGLSGLCCARELVNRGLSVAIFESDDAVGGRVRTDVVDGFRLDRGFQVLLTSYPEAQRVLDYDALDLQAFEPGARVWTGSGFDDIGDPFRRPSQALPTLTASVGTLADKLRVLNLRRSVTRPSLDEIWARPEMTTARALRSRYGFSERMVDRFFAPFLGGVFLDPALTASSRSFEFYFRMFSTGEAVVPNAGMQAIPEQLAAGLPEGALHLHQRVASVQDTGLVLDNGDRIEARAVVVATNADAAAALLPEVKAPSWRSTVCLYWAADIAPTSDPVLVLDGTGTGPVNNVQVMSAVAPGYAPEGQALVSASVLGNPSMTDEELDAAARRQLDRWFGNQVSSWRGLPTARVPYALPSLPSLDPPERPMRLRDGLYVTGDHRRNASINGAMVAGRHAAEAIVRDLT
ncbi:MAG: NAD(P)/FAD-dependent oxidoreductase [Rubricoccaceae bacterium]